MAAWDLTLCKKLGARLGRNTADMGINAVLGPALNIKRHPLCGRNFEYFRKIHVLSGEPASAFREGAYSRQGRSRRPSITANNQERGRLVSSEIDERTL